MQALLVLCVIAVFLGVGWMWIHFYHQRQSRKECAELLSELRKARHV